MVGRNGMPIATVETIINGITKKKKVKRPNESQKAMIIDVMESVGEIASEIRPLVYLFIYFFTYFGKFILDL